MTRPHLLARVAAPLALVLSGTLGVACTPTTSSPPADPSGADAGFGPADLPPGSHVQINKNGQWLPGKIVQPLGGGRFIVGYDGYGQEWNEAVTSDRVKASGPAGAPLLARDYRPGEKVLVTSQGRTVLGDVVQQVAADQWRVHYDGFGPEAAENVLADRLRRPFAGASVHNSGEPVIVDVNGQAAPGKVLALVAADRWLVRFDGASPQYDQEIGADRIRTAALPPPVIAPPPVVETPPPPVVAETPKADKGKKKKGDKDKPEKPEKPEPAAAPPAAASAPLAIGDAVLVSIRGAYHPGSITAAGPVPGAWKVKLDGGGEEDAGADRVVRFAPPQKGVKYAPQQAVMVEWHGLWVPGKVLKDADKGQYKIRYEGQPPEADEVIPARRLRPRS